MIKDRLELAKHLRGSLPGPKGNWEAAYLHISKHAGQLVAALEAEPPCACGGESRIKDLEREVGNWKVLAALGRDVPYLLAMADVEERLREEMGKPCACGREKPLAEGYADEDTLADYNAGRVHMMTVFKVQGLSTEKHVAVLDALPEVRGSE